MDASTLVTNPTIQEFVAKNLVWLAPPIIAILVVEQFLKAGANLITGKLKKKPVSGLVWFFLPVPLGIIYMWLVPMEGKNLKYIFGLGTFFGIANERLYVWVFEPWLRKWKMKNQIVDAADDPTKQPAAPPDTVAPAAEENKPGESAQNGK